MEVKDFYEYDSVRLIWRTKYLIPCTRQPQSGEKVFLHNRPTGNLRVGDVAEYLFSIGCTRVMNVEEADVVIIDYYTLVDFVKYYDSNMPEDVHPYLQRLSDMVGGESFYRNVKDFKVNAGAVMTLDYSTYENIWNLFKSNDYDNRKLAAVGVMRCNWQDNKFLLNFIAFKFHGALISTNLGELPGWSDFAKYHKISWKNSKLYGHKVIDEISKTGITPEQALLITKLTK